MTDFIKSCVEFVGSSISCAENLASVHARCFEVSWSTKDFHQLLTLPSVFGFMAIVKSKDSANYTDCSQSETRAFKLGYAGFVLCLVGGEECEILTICVLPEWRRNGLAINLIKNVITRARKFDVKKVLLEVAEDNEVAQYFYVDQGFEAFGRRNHYYQQKKRRVDAIQYHKIII
ncbi:MAG: N-acetyltransferase [Pseudomonadota bacterium]|nr:N-acetyltransferase [Pseudomonadota bacterium]